MTDMLIEKYKKHLPLIDAHWDLSEEAINYNDINTVIKAEGISLYECTLIDLFQGIYQPSIYEAQTLWDANKHNNRKIADVIKAWELKKSLSPIFLVKHGKENLALVADGKHRLTVSAAINASEMYFMASRANSEWILQAFPSARKIF